MHTATVHLTVDPDLIIHWDSFQIHSSGLMVFERRGYPDKYLPMYNVLWIEMGAE